MIRIYGASDDLVELEGSFVFRGEHHSAEEIGSYEADVELVIGAKDATAGSNAAGCRVRMHYGDGKTGGVWRAQISPLEEGVSIPWPVRISARDCTAVVEIECPPGTVVTREGDPMGKVAA